MKSSINNIISFILMILISLLFLFLLGEMSLRGNMILNSLNEINYYDDAYKNIIDKVSQYIVNDDIKNDYLIYINKDMIKKDIKNVVNDKDYAINHYDEFYIIIGNYTDDDAIKNKYASSINNIYVSNIFPVREYKLLDKIKYETSDIIFYSIIIFSIILLLGFVLYVINKNFRYHLISFVSSLILICFPYVFMNITSFFNSFVYTNSYYTRFLLEIINNIKNNLFIIGVVLLIIIFSVKAIKNIVKKNVK